MHHDTEVTGEPLPPSVRRMNLLVGMIPLLLGLALFELTANPMLAIAVACFKFGWEDFLTAAWLLWTDVNKPRGLACASSHVALGSVKTCVAGLAAVFTLIIVHEFLEGKAGIDPLTRQLLGALFTILGGGFLLVAATTLAIVTALVFRLRIWVGSGIHQSRRQRLWPPRFTRLYRSGENAVGALLAGICILLKLSGPFLSAIAISLFHPSWGPAMIVSLLLISFVVSNWLALRLNALIARRMAAHSPQECWPEIMAKP